MKKERLEKYNAKLLELGDAFNRDEAWAGGLGRAEPSAKCNAVATAGILNHLKCNYFNASSTSILYDNERTLRTTRTFLWMTVQSNFKEPQFQFDKNL